MIPEIYIIRDKNSNKATFSLIIKEENGINEESSIRDIPILTGNKNRFTISWDWIPGGGGGIPEGDFFLWTEVKINAGQKIDPEDSGEVGKYSFSISSGKKLRERMNSNRGNRTYLELHDDNNSPGSLGCPVTVDHDDFIYIKDIIVSINALGIAHIPLKVRRK